MFILLPVMVTRGYPQRYHDHPTTTLARRVMIPGAQTLLVSSRYKSLPLVGAKVIASDRPARIVGATGLQRG